MPVLGVLVLPPVVGEGTIGGRCVELDAVEISTVSCAVVAVPSVTVLRVVFHGCSILCLSSVTEIARVYPLSERIMGFQ